jgi:bifunctional DNA-binding transcriptional regulator/antitoxin component of YhaV-PrlF toxin-antitoxin module
MAEHKWVLPVDEEGVIVFPPELIEKMGWTEETILQWDIEPDGQIKLTAASDEDAQQAPELCSPLQPLKS